MIYTTGTVNTVSGSAIVRGTGTKFKNNNPAINIGMTILIKSGNTNIPYMIKSVNSDTELVLAHPALATVNNTTFSIHITEPDNNSDAARTMVAINAYTQYFLDAMNTWMSETGQTKIEMPNGETITLDSIKKMQVDIGNKLDVKTGGNVTGRVSANPISVTRDNTSFCNLYPPKSDSEMAFFQYNKGSAWNGVLNIPKVPSGVIFDIPVIAGNAITNYGKTDWTAMSLFKGNGECGFIATDSKPEALLLLGYRNSNGSNQAVVTVPKRNGEVMLVGDYGVGLVSNYISNNILENLPNTETGFFAMVGASDSNYFKTYGAGINIRYDANGAARLFIKGSGNAATEYRVGGTIRRNELWGSLNTTTDPQGFIKKASPVININSDGTFNTNDESEGATVTRVTQGEYLIEGVLGFNSDASWGGVDGGIEIPLDVNKQPLIWVNSKINKDGSILVKTYHRTHSNAPSFANNKIDGFKNGDPIDIPDGRFISVRVQMPEQSIYNVRMREMEEAQKAEEERRQKEEEENQDTNSAPEIDN